MNKDVKGQDLPGATPNEPADEERRDALRRFARFGAYTAPAMLAMLASEKAPAATDGV
jgi:hypothetical protein